MAQDRGINLTVSFRLCVGAPEAMVRQACVLDRGYLVSGMTFVTLPALCFSTRTVRRLLGSALRS